MGAQYGGSVAVACMGKRDPGAPFCPLGVVLSIDLFKFIMLLPSAEVLGPTPS